MQPQHVLGALPLLPLPTAPGAGIYQPRQCPCRCSGRGHAGRWSPASRAANQWEVGGVARCHQACQGGQVPVVALGCSLMLLGPVHLWRDAAHQTLCVLVPELKSHSVPAGGEPAGPRPSVVEVSGLPQLLLIPITPGLLGSRRRDQTHPGSWDCERPSAGLCVLGPWGRRRGWNQEPGAMGPTRPSPILSAGDMTPFSQGCPDVGRV